MGKTAIIDFKDLDNGLEVELEIPLDITANDLSLALNEAYNLRMDTENIFSCYLVAENPIAFLRGNKMLEEFGVRNGTIIIYKRG